MLKLILRPRFLSLLAAVCLLSACIPLASGARQIEVRLVDDGREQTVQVVDGATVSEALTQADLNLNPLDRVEPDISVPLHQDTVISIIRVKESFEVLENPVPFDQQTVRNETLAEGQQMLVQAGVNGLEEVTYRVLTENGIEISRTVSASRLVQEPLPEIIMVGVHSPVRSTTLPGRLAFLAAGSAWMIETSTGNRQPLILSGDLDGRVFELSKDRDWLLFTRTSADPASGALNSLWAADLSSAEIAEYELGVENVIHFAAWVPGANLEITCSTVEPRETAPGWQANNDLIWLQLSSAGRVINRETIIEPHSGGLYGWWGTTYAWAPDGSALAFARPDAVGLVDPDEGDTRVLAEIMPAQTDGDWAWIPGLAWGADSQSLLWVDHETLPGYFPREKSPAYALVEIDLSSETKITRVTEVGMFALPTLSPDQTRMAFLQAILPGQSETSRYRLVLSRPEGTRQQVLFPDEGAAGLTPQTVEWSPGTSSSRSADHLAYVYQGNLWLVDSLTGNGQQVTADGTITDIDWK